VGTEELKNEQVASGLCEFLNRGPLKCRMTYKLKGLFSGGGVALGHYETRNKKKGRVGEEWAEKSGPVSLDELKGA